MLRSKTRAESLELDENLMFINKSDTAAARRSSEPFSIFRRHRDLHRCRRLLPNLPSSPPA
jgi:hypothetical protein